MVAGKGGGPSGATLRVVEGLHRLRGRGFVTEAPKSARGKRNIDLSPAAVILLRGHKEQEAAKALLTGRSLADDDVFGRFDGSTIRPEVVKGLGECLLEEGRGCQMILHPWWTAWE